MKENNDFIGIYPNCLSIEDCQLIIDEMENTFETQSSTTLISSELYGGDTKRRDFCLFASGSSMENSACKINNALQKCLIDYSDKYFVIKSISASSDMVKLQKTTPRGGYHVWHCETTDRSSSSRVLTWMIYLNTIPDGEGETEFLWQGIRVKPVAGTALFWPAAFTHFHRGNPVYSCNKYVATGWYHYAS